MITVVAALIRENGRILICKRPEGKHFPGYWEFPGGKCEPGETLQQGLIRECREELEIDVSVGEQYGESEYREGELALRFHLLEAKIVGGTMRPLVHSELRWVRPSELGNYTFPPADLAIIQRLSKED